MSRTSLTMYLFMLFMCFSENEYVIHVDCYYSAVNEWFEYVVHEILKCGWRIGETKKHYSWCHTSEVFYQYGQDFSLYLIIFLLF